MSTTQSHYQQLLAEHYTWMFGGDIEATAAAQRSLLSRIGVEPPSGERASASVAVDLGCGSGAQTLALADLGFGTVVGVDTDADLLAELAVHAGERPGISTQRADAVSATEALEAGSVDLVACMGDTLPHLPSTTEVDRLVNASAAALRKEGLLVLSYLDLARPIDGQGRFIPVRSDDEHIMVCVLTPQSSELVEVTDIIHTKSHEGWTMRTSSYPKLRLSADSIRDLLTTAGLAVEHHDQLPSCLWVTVGRA